MSEKGVWGTPTSRGLTHDPYFWLMFPIALGASLLHSYLQAWPTEALLYGVVLAFVIQMVRKLLKAIKPEGLGLTVLRAYVALWATAWTLLVVSWVVRGGLRVYGVVLLVWTTLYLLIRLRGKVKTNSIRGRHHDGKARQNLIEHEHPVARLWERGVAALVDGAVASWCVLGILLAAGHWDARALPEALVLLGFAGPFAYFIVVEGLLRIKTPGKAIMGLEVRSSSWSPPTRRQYLARNIGRAFDLLPLVPCYLLGAVCIATDLERRRIGDRLAGTLVTRDPSQRLHLVPLMLILLASVLLYSFAFGSLPRTRELQGHPRIETEILMPLPVSVNPVDGRLPIVLRIRNVGDAAAKDVEMEVLGPDFVKPFSPHGLFIGDLDPGGIVDRTISFRLTAGPPSREFVLVVKVTCDHRGFGTIEVPAILG